MPARKRKWLACAQLAILKTKLPAQSLGQQLQQLSKHGLQTAAALDQNFQATLEIRL
jgi:hypothetical protein